MTYTETGRHLNQTDYEKNAKLLEEFRKKFTLMRYHNADVLLVFAYHPNNDIVEIFKNKNKIVVYANDIQTFKDKYPEHYL
jgi:hypothetical protein